MISASDHVVSAIFHHLLSSRCRLGWVRVLGCLAVLVLWVPLAHAHGVAPAMAPVAAVSMSEHMLTAADTDAADEANHGCPSGTSHTDHRACLGGGVCHAMTIGAEIVIDLHPRLSIYQPIAIAAGDGRVIAPLPHPPKL